MYTRKTLQELTLKDNFMFGAVMSIEENCKCFLEMTLGFPIDRIVVSREKSLIYHPEYKGIRLDIYADDTNHTHYNVEMQVSRKRAYEKRSRYYHSQIDMELLGSGLDYSELPNSYVIFICLFDPFDRGRYCYTFQNLCKEETFVLADGCQTIFLSTEGTNDQEVSESLVKFLKFVKADLEESAKDYADSYVHQLQNSIRGIKESREMGERYMVFEEMMQEEREEGRIEGRAEGRIEGRAEGHIEGLAEGRIEGLAEGRIEGSLIARRDNVLELLAELESIPQSLIERLQDINDADLLSVLLKKAARAASMEEFIKAFDALVQAK